MWGLCFLQQCCWKFKSSGMLLCVTGPIVPDVSKCYVAFILRIRLSKKTGLFFSEDERHSTFEILVTTSPAVQLYALEDSDLTNTIYNTEDHNPCRLSVTVTFPAGREDFPVGTEQSEYRICHRTRSIRTKEYYWRLRVSRASLNFVVSLNIELNLNFFSWGR